MSADVCQLAERSTSFPSGHKLLTGQRHPSTPTNIFTIISLIDYPFYITESGCWPQVYLIHNNPTECMNHSQVFWFEWLLPSVAVTFFRSCPWTRVRIPFFFNFMVITITTLQLIPSNHGNPSMCHSHTLSITWQGLRHISPRRLP